MTVIVSQQHCQQRQSYTQPDITVSNDGLINTYAQPVSSIGTSKAIH